jgi:hypothetical protein
MVVCSSLKEVEDMAYKDYMSGNIHALPQAVRKKICFMRVWCLVEAQQACQMGIPYIMKCGSYEVDENGGVCFKSNKEMLKRMIYLVDVNKAEATVASDRERIIADVEKTVGKKTLNSTIRGSIIAGFFSDENSALVACAACGDEEAIRLLMEDPSSILNIAKGGYIGLLRRLVGEKGAMYPPFAIFNILLGSSINSLIASSSPHAAQATKALFSSLKKPAMIDPRIVEFKVFFPTVFSTSAIMRSRSLATVASALFTSTR